MDDFLPMGTEIPAAGDNYFKFTSGENKFRILSSAIVGYELWMNNKPNRRKEATFNTSELNSADINKFTGDKSLPKYFWAFIVWNYGKSKIQIMEVTQVKIMRGIESYLHDDDYGDPKGYDLVVTQFESEKGQIDYSVKAKPPKEFIWLVAEDEQKVKNINLNALYDGGDPFTNNEQIVSNEEIDSI